MVSTCQACRPNHRLCLRSRQRVASNFADQTASFDLGMDAGKAVEAVSKGPATRQEAMDEFKQLADVVWATEEKRFRLMVDWQLWELCGMTAVEMFQKCFGRASATYARWRKKYHYVDPAKSTKIKKGMADKKVQPDHQNDGSDDEVAEDQVEADAAGDQCCILLGQRFHAQFQLCSERRYCFCHIDLLIFCGCGSAPSPT